MRAAALAVVVAARAEITGGLPLDGQHEWSHPMARTDARENPLGLLRLFRDLVQRALGRRDEFRRHLQPTYREMCWRDGKSGPDRGCAPRWRDRDGVTSRFGFEIYPNQTVPRFPEDACSALHANDAARL